MQRLQYSGSKAEWYDSVITGYLLAASALTVALVAIGTVTGVF